ncbi:hypothetical protein AVEN_49135-1 [Araneus ventricosus]|uniref:Tc1-like transposase DDE domain-containing protein n=1 Tax=Araneus ventricosus TaxID=182803 RepID=A0A4Y2C1Y5_ARAVE|nr:hypothetical protein AVEN_49135-1 [Araneus ventricosus]
MWVPPIPPLHLKMKRHLLQLLSVIRINLSADLQLNPESHHPARTESCGRHYTCFRTRFNAGTPYQFKVNNNERISLTRCSKMIDGSSFDVGRIWFTDEAHFHLGGVVNRHNWRFWGTENPHLSHAQPLHSPKLTIWAAISCKDIIGPFLLPETVTIDRYIALLKQFVVTQQELDDLPGTVWFKQVGARPHRTQDVFDFLDEFLDDRVLALNYSTVKGKGIDWPPYSPDLTPCDYFLWAH